MLSLEATTFPSACFPAAVPRTEEELSTLWDTRQLGAVHFCLKSSPWLLWITDMMETQVAASLFLTPSRKGAMSTPTRQHWTYGCSACPYGCVTGLRLLNVPAMGRYIVHMAWKLGSHCCKRGGWGGGGIAGKQYTTLSFEKNICCATPEPSRMSSGTCLEAAEIGKGVSKHLVHDPPTWGFILTSLNSVEVNSWLEKPTGQATSLFHVWDNTCWSCFCQLKRLLGLMHNFF